MWITRGVAGRHIQHNRENLCQSIFCVVDRCCRNNATILCARFSRAFFSLLFRYFLSPLLLRLQYFSISFLFCLCQSNAAYLFVGWFVLRCPPVCVLNFSSIIIITSTDRGGSKGNLKIAQLWNLCERIYWGLFSAFCFSQQFHSRLHHWFNALQVTIEHCNLSCNRPRFTCWSLHWKSVKY